MSASKVKAVGTVLMFASTVATFPIEFLKTVSQFAPRDVHGNRQKLSPVEIVRSTLEKEGPKGLFRGCSALVVGNAGKAGVRFFAFERFRNMLKNKATVSIDSSQ